MSLDAEAADFLSQLTGQPGIAEISIEQNRARVGALPGHGPAVANTAEITIPLVGRVLAGRMYQPQQPVASTPPLLMFFHGGGWIMGSIDSHDHLARGLCHACGCDVLSVEYRLAPEHPYPAAIQDAYDATVWAATQFGSRRPMLVAGDSAGGNLAAATALLCRDRGTLALVLQILIYPIVDCRFDTTSYQQHATGLNLTRADMQYFWDLYCPDELLRVEPQASPLRTFDLTRLAPAIVVAAGYDPLYSEGMEYALRLERAGVSTSLIECAGTVHGFMRRVESFSQARQVLDQIGRQVREQFS